MYGTADISENASVTAVPTTAVLGCFDGVHLGHRALLEAAASLSARLSTRPLVISFATPPAFAFGKGGKLLTDTEERRALFAAAGIPHAVFLHFEEVKDMAADAFLRDILVGRYGVNSAVCGYNFTFGKGRSGTPDTLRAFFGERALVCPPVFYAGEPVSSSRIRLALEQGNLDAANGMLGRPFSVTGVPERGRGDGTAIGTPTANLFTDTSRALPAPGVYICEALLHKDGRVYSAVTDAGFAPTLDTSGRFRLEAHLLGFSGVLYGEPVTLRFLRRLREEKHFASAADLQAAIARDVEAALAYFAERSDKE